MPFPSDNRDMTPEQEIRAKALEPVVLTRRQEDFNKLPLTALSENGL
jgi:hypothetical protein